MNLKKIDKRRTLTTRRFWASIFIYNFDVYTKPCWILVSNSYNTCAVPALFTDTKIKMVDFALLLIHFNSTPGTLLLSSFLYDEIKIWKLSTANCARYCENVLNYTHRRTTIRRNHLAKLAKQRKIFCNTYKESPTNITHLFDCTGLFGPLRSNE